MKPERRPIGRRTTLRRRGHRDAIEATLCSDKSFDAQFGHHWRAPPNGLYGVEYPAVRTVGADEDLLTPAEEIEDTRTGALRFDIGLLAARTAAMAWIGTSQPTADVDVGLFGASTGAAAALVAAAQRPDAVAAIVSRGGRPDLAGEFLPLMRQPTPLIVGSRDSAVLQLNREAMAQLAGEAELQIVPGATHLFAEAGALEQVAHLATDWFVRHFSSRAPRPAR